MKVYVVGEDVSYAEFIQNVELVSTIEEADVVLLTGGEDVHPSLYDDIQFETTYSSIHRDNYEIEKIDKAINLDKFILGICRGAQLGCVAAGGKLIQHMSHPFVHKITMWDDTEVPVNSLHHQMMYPFNLHKDDYKILGYSVGLSNIHFNGKGENLPLPHTKGNKNIEPEVVFFDNINLLGIQCHPEMLSEDSRAVMVFNQLIKMGVQGTIMNINETSHSITVGSIVKHETARKQIIKASNLPGVAKMQIVN